MTEEGSRKRKGASGRPFSCPRRPRAHAVDFGVSGGMIGAPSKGTSDMTDTAALEAAIEAAWAQRETLTPATGGPAREAVEAALDGLDAGTLRVASPTGTPGEWTVQQWLKK